MSQIKERRLYRVRAEMRGSHNLAVADIVGPPAINGENLGCYKTRFRDARNATALAISSGRPVRPTIVSWLIFRTRAWNSSSLCPALAISVTIQPGATALTVIPRRCWGEALAGVHRPAGGARRRRSKLRRGRRPAVGVGERGRSLA